MSDADINYTREAFLQPWNLVFLVVALLAVLGTSFVGLLPEMLFTLALVFVAAAELLYLGVMPRQERFRRLVRAQKAAERHKPPSPKEIFRHLSHASQRRYARLRRLRQEIQTNYHRLSYASQGLLESHLKKIDGLLDSFLNLIYQKERFEGYAGHTSEAEVERALEALHADMKGDAERVRRIKERRLHILEQRLARFQRSRENLEIIAAQLETVEDTVRYIHEQSWTLQHPEEITFQLDTLLEEVEETQHAVREIEDVFSPPPGGLLDNLHEPEDEEHTRTPPNRSQMRS